MVSESWKVDLTINRVTLRFAGREDRKQIEEHDLRSMLTKLSAAALQLGYRVHFGESLPTRTNCPLCGRIVRNTTAKRCPMCGLSFITDETR